MSAKKAKKITSSPAAVVTEDRRIYFKQQLVQFRENEEIELRFPSNLTSTERKFIHRVATELGLSSKSSGSGENRFITVRKAERVQGDTSNNQVIKWSLTAKALNAIQQINFDDVFARLSAFPSQTQRQFKSGTNKQSYHHRDVKGSYKVAELKRRHHPDYETLQRNRNLLPAAFHRLAVCSIVQENNIVLISGETGKL
jgi:hypothetical protein